MSGTMSGSNNDHWQLQFYQNNQPTSTTALPTWSGDAASDATVVTTTTNSISNQLNRVNRPTNNRRRSRASRKTPTTLLNTDTTNFRAMVQRYTGGGNNNNTATGDATSSPIYLSNESSVTSTQQFFPTYNSNPSSFIDGVNASVNSGMALRPNDGYNLHFRQPQHQPYFTMMVEDGGSLGGREGDDQNMGFRQRPGSYNW